MSFDYVLTWCLYGASVAGCSMVLWSLLYAIGGRQVAWGLALLLAVILLVPVQVDPDMPDRAPAFIAALLDALSYGAERAMQRLWPIIWAVLLALPVIATLAFFLRRRSEAAKE